MKRLPLYFNTVRHLRPGQVARQVKRRLHPPRPPREGPPIALRNDVQHGTFVRAPDSVTEPGQLSFVGLSRSFNFDAPDWIAAEAPKLWRYNLHYFDFLGWHVFAPALKAALIESWIAHVPVGATDAWEPYPISLRAVNWLKYMLGLPRGSVPKHWLASLSHQLAALEADLEYHLLANHLLKNGKALAFAGLCLEGPAAPRWLSKGLEIVLGQAREQVLPDGGHFERSPMYHCIVLEDYLDLCNLAQSNPERVPQEAVAELQQTAQRAAQFLSGILTGAGDIPLFNDAAFGITVPAKELLDYAGVVVADEAEICFAQTGYFGYRRGGDSLIVDCGPVGPDYQPGHAHCDTLSYELHVGGLPVVTDSGTFDYEPGSFRQFLRSTEAHATVRIDGQEQSQIWGAFRVGRRAKPTHAHLSRRSQHDLSFTGEHDGYRHLQGSPIHCRDIHISAARWEICDKVTGSGQHQVESFIPLHPAVRCEATGERGMMLTLQDGTALRFTFEGPVALRRIAGAYCPRFGVREKRDVLVLEYRGALPVELHYAFERL